jgi:PAS domain S-box-containing protein
MFGLSEREHAELALRESDQRYHALVEAAPDVIFTISPQAILSSFNAAFERLTGWPRERWIDKPLHQLVHPHDLALALDMLARALSAERTPTFELRILTSSGEYLFGEFTVTPLMEDGEATGVLGIVRDVTPRRKTEDEIQARGRILEAVAFAAEQFLAGRGGAQGIQEVLRRLAYAASVDRVAVNQNIQGEDGDIHVHELHSWTDRDVHPPDHSGPQELRGLSYRAMGCDRWIGVLGGSGVVSGHVRDFPPDERAWLEREGYLSIAIVPIFVGAEWWGTISYGQLRNERDWSPAEIRALKAAAGLFGASIHQAWSDEALRESEDRYRRLVELSPDAIVVHKRGVVEFANLAAAKLIGTGEPEELVGQPWLQFIHPDSRPLVMQRLEELQEGRPVPLVAQRFLRVDGEAVDVEVAATPFQHEGDIAVQVVARDATERARAQDALRASEERYRLLVERIPAITYTAEFGDQGRWLFVSPQIEVILGFSPEEWMATPDLWSRQLHPDDARAVLALEERSHRTMEPIQCEYRLFAKDGRAVWVRDDWVVTSRHSGDPILQGVIFDITERKQAEEDLERALSIEREAAERLRALDELKNTFLHAVSHELRTPLSAVLGLSLTLERDEVQLSAGEHADMVHRLAANARKLDRLLADLLDLDRLDRGIMEPRRRPTDVAALVGRIVDSSDLIGARSVRVVTQPVVIPLDASKVERIVENLLANAARHTPPETTIWVRVAPDHDGVLLCVEDDGPGISDTLRDTIFEPFRQGPDASGHSAGVGIGLSLVSKFAELHGGRAWVEERPGGGASFKVFLPGEAG